MAVAIIDGIDALLRFNWSICTGMVSSSYGMTACLGSIVARFWSAGAIFSKELILTLKLCRRLSRWRG